MSFLIVANWKMQGSKELAVQFKKSLEEYLENSSAELVVCPPFVYLESLKSDKYELGAQDVSRYSGFGAHTGEVSAKMLVDIGCHYVIIGHSERRKLEGTEEIKVKIKAAREQGLKVILCVGESEKDRLRGEHLEVIASQITELLGENFNGVQIAYEPLWAIGSGKIIKTEQLIEVADLVKSRYLSSLEPSDKNWGILYGGSVSEENAKELSDLKQIKGLLIGASSLDCIRLIKIINSIC